MHQVIEFYEQNLKIARETGDSRGEMSALGSLGRAYDALNERDKAVECFELSLKIARAIGDARTERSMLKHLSEPPDATEDDATEDKAGVQLKMRRSPRRKKDSSATQSASKSSPRKKARSRTKKTQ
jgi:tetratricopeptide (TPR) repeat protein